MPDIIFFKHWHFSNENYWFFITYTCLPFIIIADLSQPQNISTGSILMISSILLTAVIFTIGIVCYCNRGKQQGSGNILN